MASTPANIIEIGAKHLIAILNQHDTIRYRHFYDGTDKTSDQLAAALGLTEHKDWYCVEHVIDLAVHELSVQGVVEVRELPELLPDDTNDYEIALTPKGKLLRADLSGLRFWDAE